MLHALELENFKAFGERARIPFAPITLIFGENSAGKSTILQALNLLKQTRENPDTGALLLAQPQNGIVDLGNFKEMLFDHDLERTLSIRVETKMDQELGIEFSFKRSSVDQEVRLNQIQIYEGKFAKRLAVFRPFNTTQKLDEFSMRKGFSGDSFFRNERSFLPKKLTAVKCDWLTNESEYWRPEFEWCKTNKEQILNRLKERYSYPPKVVKQQLAEGHHPLIADIEFFSSDFDLNAYISKWHKEENNTILGVQGFLPIGIISAEGNSSIIGTRSLLRRQSDDMEAFDVAGYAIAAGRALEQTLETLFSISPFRRPPERLYIFTGTSPQDVGYRGDLLPSLLFRRPELVKETNEWLKRLDIGHELVVKSVGADSNDLFEVRLIDTRRKEPVNVALPDVGFGISQLLPFVVQSLVSEQQIISIEQPEVHVHPKLQADLGDLLAAAIKEPRRNRFIIETHSEHLILRLQRLIYKGEIKPGDVSVIYVSRGDKGAKVERLHLDEEGDFIDEWPHGFFLERLRELR